MELRSHSHLHFIQAIKGNLVLKQLNVNTRGRPALMFKNVKEIYEAGGTEHRDSVPTIRPKDELESMQFDPNRVKFESLCLPMAERRTIGFDTSELNHSDDDGGKNSNLDDFSFGSMTLKQIRESCKVRKRKFSECVDFCKQTSENFFPSDQVHTNLDANEDEFDLKETLISWKSKISKNKKGKRKRIRSHVSTICQSATVMVKAEPIYQNFLQPSGSLPEPINIKLELDEFGYSNFQTKVCVSADSSFDCNGQGDSCGVVIDEAHVPATECVMETDASMSLGEEKNCTINKPCCQNVEHCQANNCVSADTSFDCNEQVDSCGVIDNEEHVTANENVLETDAFTSFGEEQYTVNKAGCEYIEHADPESVFDAGVSGWEIVNEVSPESCEYMEHADSESVFDAGVSGWEIVNVDSPEILSYQFPDFPVVNLENEVYVIRSLLDGVSQDSISYKDLNTDVYHNSFSLSSTHSQSWPSSSDRPVQALDMVIDNRIQCMGIINEDGAYPLEDSKKDYLPSDLEGSAISPISHCIPSWSLNSLADDLPLAEKKQPFLSACANAPRSCSAEIQPFDATDEVVASAECGDCYHSKLQRAPERLFSTRKSISPTSQERLCKAMKSIELHDEKHSECRGKLLFGNQAENEVVRSEGCSKIRKTEVTINAKQVLRKSKYDKKGLNPKADLKGPHLSSAVPSLSTGCTSPQKLSQNAIAFTQRQMHDIESLTTKLMTELSSMKDLVKDMLPSEACPASSFKHNMAKVTVAIKNATKAEETAKRWLSIMARDCNRFCKIMKLTEAGSIIPSPGRVPRERKKITFADEAGGKLCHVKVFKDDMASPLEPIEIE
ncbi:Endoribonuclease Dicer-like protein [Melia azedarach]|uniref:Endoribonuclease Dicer-like protein n=1 Tax=Melia azedarach TaxID=155640 RepID=A0ACC1WRQ1_MELAZ|nr:Endoribonuclease Dicer-like protein [Melia azedarach]